MGRSWARGERRDWRSGNLGGWRPAGSGRRGASTGPDAVPEWARVRRAAAGHGDLHGRARPTISAIKAIRAVADVDGCRVATEETAMQSMRIHLHKFSGMVDRGSQGGLIGAPGENMGQQTSVAKEARSNACLHQLLTS